mgnify:FL=1
MQPQKTLFRILICIFFVLFVITVRKYIELRKSQTKEITQQIKPIKENSVVSWVTLYHPTAEQCGNNKNITFSGEKGNIGGCAVSQKMLDYYCNIGDTIVIDSGTFKGRYKVNDKAGSKGLLIDIWRPIGDSLKGCYKTKIKIKIY